MGTDGDNRKIRRWIEVFKADRNDERGTASKPQVRFLQTSPLLTLPARPASCRTGVGSDSFDVSRLVKWLPHRALKDIKVDRQHKVPRNRTFLTIRAAYLSLVLYWRDKAVWRGRVNDVNRFGRHSIGNPRSGAADS